MRINYARTFRHRIYVILCKSSKSKKSKAFSIIKQKVHVKMATVEISTLTLPNRHNLYNIPMFININLNPEIIKKSNGVYFKYTVKTQPPPQKRENEK